MLQTPRQIRSNGSAKPQALDEGGHRVAVSVDVFLEVGGDRAGNTGTDVLVLVLGGGGVGVTRV